MEGLAKFVAAVTILLRLLNMLGGIVSGIWLAILGQWSIIGYGLVAIIVSGFCLSLAIMPALLFAAPAALLYEKDYKLAFYFFGFLATLYTMSILTVWCMAVLFLFTRQAEVSSIIPILLWSYVVATAPIAWIAQKELQSGGSIHSTISSTFAQVAYILVVLAMLLLKVSFLYGMILFLAVMMVGVVMQFRIEIENKAIMSRE
ncbi:MAG TPA: hypothetical protein VMW50_02300 [Dehalococcoidia bacterium]|nr:hypothetical protein [Dehalococcoidia bacterium]